MANTPRLSSTTSESITIETPHPVAIHHDRLLWILAFGVFIFASIYAQIDLALPLDMQNKGIDETGFGTILALNPLVIVLFQVLVGQFFNRFRHSKLLAIGALFLGTGFALHMVAHTPLAYVIPVVIWTVGEMLFFPNALALIAEIAPSHLRARYQGVFYTAWGSLHFVGASLGGLLLARSGATILWGVCFGLALVTMGIFRMVNTAVEQRLSKSA